jgi:hypothetical protein
MGSKDLGSFNNISAKQIQGVVILTKLDWQISAVILWGAIKVIYIGLIVCGRPYPFVRFALSAHN